MTMFDKGIAEVAHRFGPRRRIPDAAALGRRWINPALGVLGALVLTGYLMIGHPATTLLITPALAPVALDESTRSSVLDAALGTVLAAGWIAAGAWLGIRSARISRPIDNPHRTNLRFKQSGRRYE